MRLFSAVSCGNRTRHRTGDQPLLFFCRYALSVHALEHVVGGRPHLLAVNVLLHTLQVRPSQALAFCSVRLRLASRALLRYDRNRHSLEQ
jgi:hypothetical protein